MTMLDLIGEKQAELEALCVRYRVRHLALFGSGVGETFDPSRSDLDFAVEFAPMGPGEHSESYFGLLEALEAMFQRPVDLVEYAPIKNPYFCRALEKSQVMLYEAASPPKDPPQSPPNKQDTPQGAFGRGEMRQSAGSR